MRVMKLDADPRSYAHALSYCLHHGQLGYCSYAWTACVVEDIQDTPPQTLSPKLTSKLQHSNRKKIEIKMMKSELITTSL